MSKHMDSGADDAELDDLLGEARRLRTADADPRRGRWPASDYY